MFDNSGNYVKSIKFTGKFKGYVSILGVSSNFSCQSSVSK